MIASNASGAPTRVTQYVTRRRTHDRSALARISPSQVPYAHIACYELYVFIATSNNHNIDEMKLKNGARDGILDIGSSGVRRVNIKVAPPIGDEP
jgi:hypothetical protein